MKSLALLLLLVCVPAYGCESFEDCMHQNGMHMGYNEEGESISEFNPNEEDTLQAIAYKLDEISTTLTSIGTMSMYAVTDKDGKVVDFRVSK